MLTPTPLERGRRPRSLPQNTAFFLDACVPIIYLSYPAGKEKRRNTQSECFRLRGLLLLHHDALLRLASLTFLPPPPLLPSLLCLQYTSETPDSCTGPWKVGRMDFLWACMACFRPVRLIKFSFPVFVQNTWRSYRLALALALPRGGGGGCCCCLVLLRRQRRSYGISVLYEVHCGLRILSSLPPVASILLSRAVLFFISNHFL